MKRRSVQNTSSARAEKNTGIPYEILVQSIFQEIHDQQTAHTIRVERDVTLQGIKSPHQIDVYWEFSIAGITYRTIVQAKDLGSSIKQEHVYAFLGVLNDIPGQPRGVMVTRTGFQRGARAVAKAVGVKLYLLRPSKRPHVTLTDISWADMRVDRTAGLMHVEVFRPVVTLGWRFAQEVMP